MSFHPAPVANPDILKGHSAPAWVNKKTVSFGVAAAVALKVTFEVAAACGLFDNLPGGPVIRAVATNIPTVTCFEIATNHSGLVAAGGAAVTCLSSGLAVQSAKSAISEQNLRNNIRKAFQPVVLPASVSPQIEPARSPASDQGVRDVAQGPNNNVSGNGRPGRVSLGRSCKHTFNYARDASKSIRSF